MGTVHGHTCCMTSTVKSMNNGDTSHLLEEKEEMRIREEGEGKRERERGRERVEGRFFGYKFCNKSTCK